MSRYIDANEVKRQIQKATEGQNDVMKVFLNAMHRIDKIPTADVRENVRGEWIFHKSTIEGTDDSRECSVCGVWLNWTMPRNSFCPNCGADMRGGEDKPTADEAERCLKNVAYRSGASLKED